MIPKPALCAVSCAIVVIGSSGCQRANRPLDTVADGNSRLSTLAPIMGTNAQMPLSLRAPLAQ